MEITKEDKVIEKMAHKYGWILEYRPGYISKPDAAYSIPLTEADIKDFGTRAAEYIPRSYNRQRFVKSESSKFLLCMTKRRPLKTYYKVGDRIAYVSTYNQGTKKWPDSSIVVVVATVRKITDKMIETSIGRVSKECVLGRIRRE